MKTENLTALIGLLSLLGNTSVAVAQGTAFTYQGRLDSGGQPYTGTAEFRPTLWDAPSGGAKVADNSPPQVVVAVTNGLFVLPLDFGDSFPGAERWLQLEVRTASGPFTTLSPRQKLTPTPYALSASNLTGTLPASQLTGTLPSANLGGTYSAAVTFNNPANSFTGNGAGLTGLNASQLASGTVPEARLAANMARTNQVWLRTGNAGTVPGTHFLGTTDEQPLELRVNNATAFRLLPGHNVVGGAANNAADPGVLYATISGGTGNRIQPGAAYATVGGGIDNRIGTNAVGATIAGGDGSSIGSGSSQSTIAGGNDNNIEADARSAFIGGGEENTIEDAATHAVLGGGERNTIQVRAQHAVIGGGQRNWIGSNALTATIAGGHENHISPGAQSATIGGGSNNYIETNAIGATIAGGGSQTIEAHANYASISGGQDNEVNAGAAGASIGGGSANIIQSNAWFATIGGGAGNTIENAASHAVLGGGARNRIQPESRHAVLGGGQANTVSGEGATVGGGAQNTALGMYATVAGGGANVAGGDAATVGGGSGNMANGGTATIGGGEMNRAEGSFATVAGGGHNNAAGYSAAVGGGWENNAGGLQATVAGGYLNTASGDFATVPGGTHNLAGGASSLAAGFKAEARHDGAFVWADSLNEYFRSTGTNQFLIRASGGVGINTNQPQTALHVAGTVTAEDFRGRGAGLQGVDADRLDGRDSADFALATHAHNAGDITAGTLADARLSANVPRLNAAQTFTAANQFAHPDNLFVGTFQGRGGTLTNLDANNITSGTLADARLSANIPRLNAPANFTATVSAPVLQATNLVTDPSSLNNGALAPGLILGGTGSGEGLASKRTAGGNQYGLDLFTAFSSRLAIANNGAIHIGAGNSFASYGDARSSIYVLRGTSSGASYAELFLPGTQRLSVPLNSTWTFRAFVAGRASNGKAAGYCFRGFLENESGTVRLLESVNTEDWAEDDTAWDANVAANDTYDALVVTARGNTGDSVRWTAVIYTVEVRW